MIQACSRERISSCSIKKKSLRCSGRTKMNGHKEKPEKPLTIRLVTMIIGSNLKQLQWSKKRSYAVSPSIRRSAHQPDNQRGAASRKPCLCFRHDHGGVGSGSYHRPRLTAFAASSAAPYSLRSSAGCSLSCAL